MLESRERQQFSDAVFRSADSKDLYWKLARTDPFKVKDPSASSTLAYYYSFGHLVDESKLFAELPDLLTDPETGALRRGLRQRIANLEARHSENRFPLAVVCSQVPLDAHPIH